MLRVIAVGTGAVDYLLRGSGCCAEQDPHQHDRGVDVAAEHTAERAAGRDPAGATSRYFGSAVEHGEPAGRWGGRGLAMFGIAPDAQASEGFVRSVFGRLEDPRTGESLGRAPRKFKTTAERIDAALEAEPEATPERRRELELAAAADGRHAVAYYDFTFSPPKSVSVYYAALLAAGDVEGAAAVAAAHDRAVAAAMDYAEEHVGYTRSGYHGRTADGRSVGRYEAGEGLVWTRWRHSTNRESEPQLHTHVAVLNRLRTASDGIIRALDGRGIRPVKEAIATAYERALEEELVRDRGVVMADRGDGKAREIVGVDPQLCAEASTRRAQTLERAAELTAAYVARNGREPDAAARKAILDDAALATRKPKEGLAGPAAVAAWAGLTPERQERLIATLDAVADAAAEAAAHPDVVAGARLDPTVPEQRAALLEAAIAEVQHTYATWTLGNLVAAIDRRVGVVPAAGADRPAYLEALAREALAPGNPHGVLSLTGEDPVAVPEELRRPQDGRSVFRPHCDERYATLAQLGIEQRIVAAARQHTAPALSGPELELLQVELTAAGLGADQVDAVAGIMSSGRAGDVLIGPAGTGKSTTVAALADVWTRHFGGRVLGLATTEIATRNLAEDGVPALNTARFLHAYGPREDGQPARARLAPGAFVIIDEAGMSATDELDRIEAIVRDAGGKLLYTGDSEQLTSIGAGGILALLAADNGAHELGEVHRFNQPWEREASLRLRVGDASAVVDYDDRGRLHGGTREEMQTAAMRGYLADTLADRESLLIVGTNDTAAELSAQIRTELIRLGRVDATPVSELGERARRAPVSIGDRVQARMVDRTVPVEGRAGGVANREVFTVLGVDDDGALRVEGAHGQVAHLPRRYVQDHLTLAYASTVHAAQSRTVDTCHALLDEAAAREAAYVALSRGRDGNWAYLIAQRDPDEHDPRRLDDTPAARLAAVLGNVEARPAAEVARRAGERDSVSLASIGTQWDLASRDLARQRCTDILAATLPPAQLTALTAEPGWPRLVRTVREAELAGHDSRAVLTAAAQRSLADARNASDVLRWRVRRLTADRAPEQHVGPGDWAALAPPVDGPVGQFVHELAVLAGDRQDVLSQAALADPPSWALQVLGPAPTYDDLTHTVDTGGSVPVDAVDQIAAARVEWAQRAGAIAAYRELAGIGEDVASIGGPPSREQELHHHLWAHALTALGEHTDPGVVDVRAHTDHELWALRERWTREQAVATPYVAEELAGAHRLAREYDQDTALASARLATLEPDDPAWETTAAQVERSQHLAALHRDQAEHLEQLHQARRAWYDATADVRTADQAAADELARRDLPGRRPDGRDPDPDVTPTADAADVQQPQREPDDIELEHEAHAAELDQERRPSPAPDVEPDRNRVDGVDVEPEAAREPELEPAPERAEDVDRAADLAAEERDRAQHEDDRARTALDEAGRQAEAEDEPTRQEEVTPEPAAEPPHDPIAEARRQLQRLAEQLEADRTRQDEEERRQQLNRWHEQDRAAEQDYGRDDGDDRGIDRDP